MNSNDVYNECQIIIATGISVVFVIHRSISASISGWLTDYSREAINAGFKVKSNSISYDFGNPMAISLMVPSLTR
jgi:hypothetical protein